MCEKCKKLLGEPKFLFEQTDLKKFMGLVDACLPILLDAQKSIIRVTSDSGTPMHPVTLGAILGWLYYASVLNGVSDGDITEEQFKKFDALLLADCREGVKRSIEEAKSRTKTEFKVVTFDELPEDIKKLVRDTIGDSVTKH